MTTTPSTLTSTQTLSFLKVYLKRWKDPDKQDARHIKVKEELEGVKCYSIELSRKLKTLQ